MVAAKVHAGRRRRLIGRRPLIEEPPIDLTDDAYSWWSVREPEDLRLPPLARDIRIESEQEPPRAGFFGSYTNDSLFAHPEDFPDDGDDGSTEIEETADLTPWVTLGVDRRARWEDVVAAHRRLAKLFHPDMSDGLDDGGATMRELNAAYSQLRAIYGR